MELADIAASFDNESFSDAYLPEQPCFLGQTDVYDGSKRDGSTVVRRVLSVAPGIEMPARLAIHSIPGGINYIVGLKIYDAFQGALVREKYILQRSTHSAVIRTTAEVLADSGGTTAKAGLLWLKNAKDERISSESTPVYNIYFTLSETIVPGNIVDLDGQLYRVKVVTLPASGFKIAECFEFEYSAAEITYTSGSTTKDIASDSYLLGLPALIQGLRERFLSFYDNPDAGRVKFETGDEVMSVLKTDVVTPNLNDEITLGVDAWRPLDIRDVGDAWALHIRRK